MSSSLDLAPASTALVLIDLQNEIIGRPLAPYSGSEVLERSIRLVSEFRKKGGTVVLVRVLVTEMLNLPADAPRATPSTPPPPTAFELAGQLDVQPTDIVITKRQWGAFYGTELDQQLRRRKISTIVLGGIATNFGVESTARAAFDRGYELVFAEDAMTSVSAEAHQFAIGTIFPRMGRIRSTTGIVDALRA
jgi:nicotinamidase-related amidase